MKTKSLTPSIAAVIARGIPESDRPPESQQVFAELGAFLLEHLKK